MKAVLYDEMKYIIYELQEAKTKIIMHVFTIEICMHLHLSERNNVKGFTFKLLNCSFKHL